LALMGASRVVLDGIIFSLQRRGGVSTYFRELGSRVMNQRNEAELWVYADGAPAGPRVVSKRPRVFERFRAPAVPAGSILHSSYYRTSGSAQANVVTVYDFIYEHLAHASLGRERFTHPAGHFIHTWQKGRAIQRADAVICISEATRRDLLEFHPRTQESKVHVVHLAAGGGFRPLPPAAAAVDPYVLFVGSRKSNKNFSSVAKGVGAARSTRLTCVGGGDFDAGELALLSRELPGRFAHAGYVDAERLNELYNGAVALVYPSSFEGFGIPILEAMAAGCPVITTRGGAMQETAGDAAVLIDAPDPDVIAHAIDQLREADARQSLVSRGLKRAAEFSWDTTAAKTLAIYSSLEG
jgi:mannosyltransferase